MFGSLRRIVLVSYAAAALALVGAAASAPSSAAPVRTAAAPPALVGNWSTTVTAATWHKHQIFYEVGGRWAIGISKRGVTAIFAPPGDPKLAPLTTMRLTTSGASAVFGPTADGFCPSKASYRWKVSEKTLALQVIHDECDARRILLTTGSWSRT